MRVTSVNGELNPPFISQKGVDYLQNNFDTNGLGKPNKKQINFQKHPNLGFFPIFFHPSIVIKLFFFLDIFVDSYAKCGTTLMIHVIYQILKHAKVPMAGASEQDMADPWTAVQN